MFTLRINELALQTVLGVFDWERQAPRPVIVRLAIDYDDPRLSDSDDIAHVVDYAAIEDAVVGHVESRRYNLVERLVMEVGELILALDSRIARVTVEAEKPGALKKAKSVAVVRSFTAERRG